MVKKMQERIRVTTKHSSTSIGFPQCSLSVLSWKRKLTCESLRRTSITQPWSRWDNSEKIKRLLDSAPSHWTGTKSLSKQAGRSVLCHWTWDQMWRGRAQSRERISSLNTCRNCSNKIHQHSIKPWDAPYQHPTSSSSTKWLRTMTNQVCTSLRLSLKEARVSNLSGNL